MEAEATATNPRHSTTGREPSEVGHGKLRIPLVGRLLILFGIITAVVVPQVLTLRRSTTNAGDRLTQADRLCAAVRKVSARPGARPLLVDITDPSGLDFLPVVGPLGTYFMPEMNGTGGALFDYDNDGDLDIYLVNSGRSPRAVGDFPPGTSTVSRLYRQDAPGVFQDVTAGSGLGLTGFAISSAVGDIDNDGDLDVYVACYGPDHLFRNNGDGTFSEVSSLAGIDSPGWSSSALFFDYNRDGWLDLFVVNYLSDQIYGHTVACNYGNGRYTYCGPRKFSPTTSQLYRNRGVVDVHDGHANVGFEDVSQKSGIASEVGAGFMAVVTDVNRDGWPDLYVLNDEFPNRLWVNDGDGRFADEAMQRGLAVDGMGRVQGSMGVALGDVNGDQLLDLMVTNVTTEANTLYLNQGDGLFVDFSDAAKVSEPSYPHTGWGVFLQDLDHDGDVDLPVVNGLVAPCDLLGPSDVQQSFEVRLDFVPDAESYWDEYASSNQLMINDGRGRFIDASHAGGSFTNSLRCARGLMYGDIDEDGDLDMLVTYIGQRARLFRNDIPKSGHWLMVRTVDPRLKRDALGAEVTVAAGNRRWVRVAHPASSYLASNDLRAHFGLGRADRYDAIEVRWPDGLTESFPAGPGDRLVTLYRGHGRSSAGE